MSTAVAAQTMTGAPAPRAVAQRTERVQAQERPAALPALTGLRFVAALWVVLCHVGTIVPAAVPAGWRGAAVLAHNLAWSGFCGVNVFFVLSGFILSYTYLSAGGHLRGTARAFWRNRLARVYPVYVLAFALDAPVFLGAPRPHPWLTGLLTLTMTQGWWPALANAWNGPGWSLSAEAFFYLLFPLLAPALARLPRRLLPHALLACWLLTVAPPYAYLLGNPDHVPNLWIENTTTWMRVLAFHPALRLPEFLSGVLLARLYVARAGAPLPAWLWPTALGGVLFTVACGPLLPVVVLRTGLLDPLFAVLLYGLACARPLRALRAVLSWRPLLLLGEASYGLYILQSPLWALMSPSGAHTIGTTGEAARVLLFVVALSSLAVLSLWRVEQPARRAIRARWG